MVSSQSHSKTVTTEWKCCGHLCVRTSKVIRVPMDKSENIYFREVNCLACSQISHCWTGKLTPRLKEERLALAADCRGLSLCSAGSLVGTSRWK